MQQSGQAIGRSSRAVNSDVNNEELAVAGMPLARRRPRGKGLCWVDSVRNADPRTAMSPKARLFFA
jgi:hypothetical protein